MKFRKILTVLKDSLFNFVRHPLVTLASFTTVTLMLILLGAFTVLSLNVNYWVETIATQPAVEVWGDPRMTAAEQMMVADYLDNSDAVLEYTFLTPEDNFDLLREQMGDDAASLENFDYSLLPYVFQVKLVSPDRADDFAAQVKGYPGVTEVDFAARVMETLSSAVRWVNVATLVMFAVMALVSLFVISNMVQLSIFAQAEEIGIMKYIGATNNYIRIPYILEGAMIGTFGAFASWGIVYLILNQVYNRLAGSGSLSSISSIFSSQGYVLPAGDVMWKVLVVNLILGILVGAAGSSLSVRKYIQV